MALTKDEIEKNLTSLADLTPEQVWDLYQIERKAIASYTGGIDELEAALGMLHMGHHLGWRPLVLVHNKRTLRKYEETLGITIREYFPEEGPSVKRSLGYAIVKRIGNFWKAVSGEIKDDELKAQRRELS